MNINDKYPGEKNFEDILPMVQRPGRYIGGEWNQIKKDFHATEVRIALAFPDLYEIGMSHLGQKILYHVLNREPAILAERVFAPWMDMEEALRNHCFPLGTLESRTPLNEFDMIGFSLLYELNYSNILTILDLGGVPISASLRTDEHPLVLGGGPAAFNPEPLVEFFDFFFIGDAEIAYPELCLRFAEWKREKKSRAEILRQLAALDGIYVPSLYQVSGKSLSPSSGAPGEITKVWERSLDQTPFPDNVVVPHINAVFDRAAVEASRGCPQNCRFCQARQLYFPWRSRSPETIVELMLNSLRETGFEDASLAALSIGDYPCIENLVTRLMTELNDRKISLSLSSLRPKSLTTEIAENILRVRKTGFTLVPEAGTDRLRSVINKHLKDEDIFTAVENAFSHGWRKLKLYFMVGLPTETMDDLQGIVVMVQEIIRRGYRILNRAPQINLSVASFIPKPHTPFQWLKMADMPDLIEKHQFVKSSLKKYPFVRFKDHSLQSSRLEGVFSRGDRGLNSVILAAWKKGARFDSWKDQFDFNIWENAFNECGIEAADYLVELDPEQPLAWDHIRTGVKKSHLLEEFHKALKAEKTPPCDRNLCRNCGGCDYGALPTNEESPISIGPAIPEPPVPASDSVHRYRLFYSKLGNARFLSHMDTMRTIQRGFRRVDIPVLFSQGFHPKMLMSFAPALPLGMRGCREILEFKSAMDLNLHEITEKLNQYLIPGINALSLQRLDPRSPDLASLIEATEYSLSFQDRPFRMRLAHIRKEMDWPDSLPDEEGAARLTRHAMEANEDDTVSEFYWDSENGKMFWTFKFSNRKSLKIQDLVGKIFSMDYPSFSLTRERLILGPDSFSSSPVFPDETAGPNEDIRDGDVI